MGLAVLPSRLKTEIALLKDSIHRGADINANDAIAKHADWAADIVAKNNITAENCDEILRNEIGKVFAAILEQCGVFDRTEEGKAQFMKFIESVVD